MQKQRHPPMCAVACRLVVIPRVIAKMAALAFPGCEASVVVAPVGVEEYREETSEAVAETAEEGMLVRKRAVGALLSNLLKHRSKLQQKGPSVAVTAAEVSARPTGGMEPRKSGE